MGKPEVERVYRPDEYAYAVGKVQALQNQILSTDTFRQIAEAPSMETAVRLLSESRFGEYLAEGLSYQELEKAQLTELKALHTELVPGDLLTGMPFVMADFSNLKYLVKSFIKRAEPDLSRLQVGWYGAQKMVDLVFEQPEEASPEVACHYSAVMQAFAAYERTEDPALIDLILDQRCYDYLYTLFRFRKADFALGFLATLADLTNLQTLLRLIIRREQQGIYPTREQKELSFLPAGTIPRQLLAGWSELSAAEAVAAVGGTKYGRNLAETFETVLKDNNWLPLERESDELKMAYLRRAKLVATGYEPVFAYFLAKENEVRLVRVALQGKAFGLPAATIRERLWGSYV
ncbi:MAG: V-type ATPase subunit [Firmicutes bacterium]|nr:V-type ATPase subunit [Bacillota bacterium]